MRFAIADPPYPPQFGERFDLAAPGVAETFPAPSRRHGRDGCSTRWAIGPAMRSSTCSPDRAPYPSTWPSEPHSERVCALLTHPAGAVWAVVRARVPAPRGSGSSRGRDGSTAGGRYVWRNMMFRNLSELRSSDLIREAVAMTARAWLDRYGGHRLSAPY